MLLGEQDILSSYFIKWFKHYQKLFNFLIEDRIMWFPIYFLYRYIWIYELCVRFVS